MLKDIYVDILLIYSLKKLTTDKDNSIKFFLPEVCKFANFSRTKILLKIQNSHSLEVHNKTRLLILLLRFKCSSALIIIKKEMLISNKEKFPLQVNLSSLKVK